MLGLIAVGLTSLFDTVGFFYGHDIWHLSDNEVIDEATAIDNFLDTLPGNYYAFIRKAIESYFPALVLTVCTSKIVVPRIETTIQARREAKRSTTDSSQTYNSVFETSGERDARFVNGNAYRNQASFR